MNPLRTDDESALLCPGCGDGFTHVDAVHISARHEDGVFREIRVNAISGEVRTELPSPGPTGARVGAGRRHRITLLGYCELCGAGLAFVFTQHKGETFVEVAE